MAWEGVRVILQVSLEIGLKEGERQLKDNNSNHMSSNCGPDSKPLAYTFAI